MNTQTRDTLALFAIASVAVLAVLYGDGGLAGLFNFVLAH